ncbi:hypothetical protein HUU05_18310 [candidate division KSB1 bacterium]|nr:hypothetical protein [candidate division KSB1 bacterium]
MRRFVVLINILALAWSFAHGHAQAVFENPPSMGTGREHDSASNSEAGIQSGGHSPQGWSGRLTYPFTEMRYELQAEIIRPQSSAVLHSFIMPEEAGVVKPQRSVKKAFLFSAIVPGSGELYNRSYLSAMAFLGVEVGAWLLYAKFTGRGNELTDEFELYANAHWDEQRYWESLARDSGGRCSASDRACLEDYERESFSHFLPRTKNQTYYENIGKYDQFNAGWDDSQSGDARQRDSANREAYTFMRLDANKQFKNATRATTVVLFNHVLSALHAAYTTHRYNQQTKASMGMRIEKYNDELVPTLAVDVAW